LVPTNFGIEKADRPWAIATTTRARQFLMVYTAASIAVCGMRFLGMIHRTQQIHSGYSRAAGIVGK
jgi:hypothetical protein